MKNLRTKFLPTILLVLSVISLSMGNNKLVLILLSISMISFIKTMVLSLKNPYTTSDYIITSINISLIGLLFAVEYGTLNNASTLITVALSILTSYLPIRNKLTQKYISNDQ